MPKLEWKRGLGCHSATYKQYHLEVGRSYKFRNWYWTLEGMEFGRTGTLEAAKDCAEKALGEELASMIPTMKLLIPRDKLMKYMEDE